MEMIRSEGTLAGAVSADTGAAVHVVSLAAHSQSMGETLALIDNLPPGSGLLAIGLSPNRLITAPATDARQISGSPFALTSPHLAAELAGRTSLKKRLPGLLPGFFDFAVSYIDERLVTRSPDLLPITYADHYYTDGPVASISGKGGRQRGRARPRAASVRGQRRLQPGGAGRGRPSGTREGLRGDASSNSPSAPRRADRRGTLTLPPTTVTSRA